MDQPFNQLAGNGSVNVDVSVAPLTPVHETERIMTLDVMRGVALLGIFMVNMQFFAMPFMLVFEKPTDATTGIAETMAWAFVKVFCEFKFISLFSLMFGMGLVVQMNRASARGRRFVPLFLRRVFILAMLGLCHGFLLWYGDVLFLYAMIAPILLLCRQLSPKVLMIISGSLIAVVTFVQAGLITIGILFSSEWISPQTAPEVEVAEAPSTAIARDESAFFETNETTVDEVDLDDGGEDEQSAEDKLSEQPLRGWQAMQENLDPTSGTWIDAEVLAYKEGPFLDAFLFRAVSYGFALAAAAFGYGWRVLAMFLLGAALMKLDFFRPDRRAWHWRLAIVGIGLGLPLEIINAWLTKASPNDLSWWSVILVAVHELGSFTLCLGYAGLIALLAQMSWLKIPAQAVAGVGRLGLTNYLVQTLTATSIMYWWGLAWFNDVNSVGQIALVLGIYCGQIVVSFLWLSVFAIGPVEWLWRSLTYLHPQPLLRKKHPH